MKRASLASPVIKSVIFIVITVTVTAMKIADLMTGPVRLLRFMPAPSG